jgi:transcriptional regulator with XRE-family HTH domain
MTQEALAESAGLSPRAVRAIENGERRYPYPATLAMLADALGLSPDERLRLAGVVARRDTSRRAGRGVDPGRGRVGAEDDSPVGRRDLVADVVELVQEHRLVVLTGAGGVGKTTVARAVAAEAEPSARA